MEKFREKNRKNKMIIIGSVLVLLLVTSIFLYRTFAIYESKEEYDVIEGKVPNYMSDYDVRVSLLIAEPLQWHSQKKKEEKPLKVRM